MPLIVDNIELDDDNVEFNFASNLVNNSNNMIYLTGKAGSGKTTFLKYIKQTSKKKTVVLAPTGVAALNAGGQTIHSFFKIAPSVYLPDDFRLRTSYSHDDVDRSTIFDNFKYRKGQRNLITGMELLIIDEISMVRCDLLDVVDKLMRVFREREDEPFGGVQVLLIGDAFQLPPIAQTDQWNLLRDHYETPFFFSSRAIQNSRPTYIELKKIYRQQDLKFINLLNNIRVNQVSAEDIDLLNSRFIPSLVKDENLNYVTISTHNRYVDETNKRKLAELDSKAETYEAEITGDFPDSMAPTEKMLNLKVGAQIMFIKNDPDKKYFNGKIGKITKLTKSKISVEFPNGVEIEVKKSTWNNIKFSWNSTDRKIDETLNGAFTQFPLKLAWSVTVHKCQGLTFDNVIADIGESFSPGQVYVALSRCTSIEGLVLKAKINRSAIRTDPNVLKFTEIETRLNK